MPPSVSFVFFLWVLSPVSRCLSQVLFLQMFLESQLWLSVCSSLPLLWLFNFPPLLDVLKTDFVTHNISLSSGLTKLHFNIFISTRLIFCYLLPLLFLNTDLHTNPCTPSFLCLDFVFVAVWDGLECGKLCVCVCVVQEKHMQNGTPLVASCQQLLMDENCLRDQWGNAKSDTGGSVFFCVCVQF